MPAFILRRLKINLEYSFFSPPRLIIHKNITTFHGMGFAEECTQKKYIKPLEEKCIKFHLEFLPLNRICHLHALFDIIYNYLPK